MSEKLKNFRGVRVVKVIEAVTYEGAGTAEDPGHLVYTYTDLDGKVLAVREWPEGLQHGSEEPF